MRNDTTLNESIFIPDRAVVDSLSDARARFFLLPNASPLQRSPAETEFETADVRIPRCAADITDRNSRLESLREDIVERDSDTSVFYLDINTLFTEVIDDPAQFDQTAVYKDTLSLREAYEDEMEEMDHKWDVDQ